MKRFCFASLNGVIRLREMKFVGCVDISESYALEVCIGNQAGKQYGDNCDSA